MVDVFISYSRADEAVTQRIADALSACGFAVWWDHALQPHKNYGEEIEEKLNAAKAVIVLWSENSARSQWVKSEADRARVHNKLIQVAIDDVSPPMPFDQIQCVRLTDWHGEDAHGGWQKVRTSAAILCERVGEVADAVPSPARRAERPRPSATSSSATAAPAQPPLASTIAAIAVVSLLPVAAAFAGLAPPGGELQTIVLVFMVATIMAVVAFVVPTLPRRRFAIVIVLLAFAAFGAAITYNLLDQRFVARDASGARVVLGCGWRDEVVAAVRRTGSLSIDTGAQCPGDYAAAAAAARVAPVAVFARQGFDLMWLLVSMAWGATFMFLPALIALFLARARQRPFIESASA